MEINGKNILLFYPYGATKHYGDNISCELHKRGATVYGYDERPSQTALMKIIIRLFKKKIPHFFLAYLKKVVKKNKDISFDYILVLRGEAFSPKAITFLRKAFPKAFTILYLWDTLGVNNQEDTIPYFDRALTFDPEDAKKIDSLIFRPTFYLPQYTNVAEFSEATNEILYVGTLHKKRHDTLAKIKENLANNGISYDFYLYIPNFIVFIKDKIINSPYAKIKDVHFEPISLDETIHKTSLSRCILDLNYPGQKSLSMRAFEALVAKKKYITTNAEIKKYDFYNENNILVIDENNPIISKSFLELPYVQIQEDIFAKYSVIKWVDDVFSQHRCSDIL